MKPPIPYRRELNDFLLLSVISPALGLSKLFQAKNERFIVVGTMLAMSFFGALFAYPEGSDGHTHYLRSLEHYSNMNFSEFMAESWKIIIQKPSFGTTDLYIHVLSFISNSILSIPKSLHFFAGLVLGYFIAKSLLLVLGTNLKTLTWKSGLFIFIILLMIHSVSSLNAIRISTGAWVLFFGVCGYYFTKKPKFLLLFLLAAQIHLAFMIIAIPAIVVLFLNKLKWLIVTIWVLSFYFQLSFLDISSYLPTTDVVESKKQYYVLDESRLEIFQEDRELKKSSLNWYAALGPSLYLDTALIIAIGGMLLVYAKSEDPRLNFMFGAALLFYAFANVVSFTPSLQGRLMNSVSIFLLFSILYYMQESYIVNKSSLRQYVFRFSNFAFVTLSLPFLIKNFSHILNTTEFFFLAAPILSFFADEDFSIRDIITYIL